MMKTRTKKCAVAKSATRGSPPTERRKNATLAEHHLPGLSQVMAALRHELKRIGDHPTKHVDGRFSWRDVVPVPAEPGAQAQRQFEGRTAAVVDAAVRCEHTYDILNGPIPVFINKLQSAQAALDEACAFARDNGAEITAAIHNGDILRQSQLAFGAEPRTAPAFDFQQAEATLSACEKVAEQLRATSHSLLERLPDVFSANFYTPGGTGPVGQFAMVLREHELAPAVIAEILARIPDRSAFQYEASWKRHRAAAVGNVKRLVNRAKRKLSRAVRAGTAEAPRPVPPDAFECVIVQLNAGPNGHISGYLAARRDHAAPTANIDSGAPPG